MPVRHSGGMPANARAIKNKRATELVKLLRDARTKSGQLGRSDAACSLKPAYAACAITPSCAICVREISLSVARFHPAAVRAARQEHARTKSHRCRAIINSPSIAWSTRSAPPSSSASDAFIFFGIPASKDAQGSSAWQEDGIVQQALRASAAGLQGCAPHHR